MKKIYCGMINIPSFEEGEDEFKFSLSPISVIDESDGVMELPTYYFVSDAKSTKFIDARYFDDEICVTDGLKLFYSKSKESCLRWLNDSRDKLLSTHKRAYESLLESTVVEEDEYNG